MVQQVNKKIGNGIPVDVDVVDPDADADSDALLRCFTFFSFNLVSLALVSLY